MKFDVLMCRDVEIDELNDGMPSIRSKVKVRNSFIFKVFTCES